MPACWVVCPIIDYDPENTGDPTKAPAIEALRNPDGTARFHYSAAIYPERGMTWCLAYVTTAEADFSGLDDDSRILRVFDEVLDDEVGAASPARQRATTWLTEAHKTPLNRLRDRLASVGVDNSGLSGNTPRTDIIRRIGLAASASLDPDFNPAAWYTRSRR